MRNKELMPAIELKKAAMAFELKDGTILWISKEDCDAIATRIVLEGMVNGEVNITMQSDGNMKKAQELHQILTNEKGMPPELRVEYYKEILRLYNEEGEKEQKMIQKAKP